MLFSFTFSLSAAFAFYRQWRFIPYAFNLVSYYLGLVSDQDPDGVSQSNDPLSLCLTACRCVLRKYQSQTEQLTPRLSSVDATGMITSLSSSYHLNTPACACCRFYLSLARRLSIHGAILRSHANHLKDGKLPTQALISKSI